MNESEKIDPRELSPLALAFVGDSVLELLVRQRLAELIRKDRPPLEADLSPHWRGQGLVGRAMDHAVPVWVVSSAALLVLSVATPEPLSVPLPRLVAPSRKLTVPVAVPVAGKLTATVAVNVTLWPNTEGLVADVSAVLVAPLLTTWLTALLVLVAKLTLPTYCAVIA